MRKFSIVLASIVLAISYAHPDTILAEMAELGLVLITDDINEGYYTWVWPVYNPLSGKTEQTWTVTKVKSESRIDVFEYDASKVLEKKPFTVKNVKGDNIAYLERVSSTTVDYYYLSGNQWEKLVVLDPGEAGYEMFVATIEHWQGKRDPIDWSDYLGSDDKFSLSVIATEGLNVRKGPSTKYSIITQVEYKQKLKKLDYRNGWYKIETEDGNVGWVCGGQGGEVWIKEY